MNNWQRNLRGALLMGLTWAIAWAPVGVLIGTIIDPDGSMDEPWVLVGTFPGFLCGVVLFTLLRMAEGRRGLDELSPFRAAVWGAMAGLLVGVLPFVLGSQNTNGRPLWLLPVVAIGSVTLLSAVSGSVSVALARWWRGRSETTPSPMRHNGKE